MLPEFTCGKTILPACSHFTALLPHLWAKSGKTMLPARGKTMSKVTRWWEKETAGPISGKPLFCGELQGFNSSDDH
jgi:hypothetical protein